jgi:hypothetical protein
MYECMCMCIGKTTLLKMVSGLETPSSGCGLINGFDIVRDRSSAQRSMGLCPQVLLIIVFLGLIILCISFFSLLTLITLSCYSSTHLWKG